MIKKTLETPAARRAQGRKTALLVGAVLGLIAAWSFYRERTTVAAVLGGVSAALVLAGLLLPSLAWRFHVLWMRFAVLLGYVNSRILLTSFYYTAFALYGVVSRLVGRDPLNRRGPRRESYWIPRKSTRQAKEQFEKLF
ncbi:MAG: hypothetical protein ACRD9R_20925 [Pyrinomonadaceae bacterium]